MPAPFSLLIPSSQCILPQSSLLLQKKFCLGTTLLSAGIRCFRSGEMLYFPPVFSAVN